MQWCNEYFDWYNFSHHHSGLNGYTPKQVFTSRYQEIAAQKQTALDDRYALNPERFVQGAPRIAMPPSKVEINPVSPMELEAGVSSAVNFSTLNRVKEKITLSLD